MYIGFENDKIKYVGRHKPQKEKDITKSFSRQTLLLQVLLTRIATLGWPDLVSRAKKKKKPTNT